MPVHPHPGIATVTSLVEAELPFDDPERGAGSIRLGTYPALGGHAGAFVLRSAVKYPHDLAPS